MIPNYISSTYKRDFFVADDTKLSMISEKLYDNVIYLQRVICFIPHLKIKDAISKSYRICKVGGVAIFSFLNYKKRKLNRPLSFIL